LSRSVQYCNRAADRRQTVAEKDPEMAFNPKAADPFELLLYATSYWKASTALVRGLALKYPFNMPTFVVEAFALELHLKCLLLVRGKAFNLTHEPKELFAMLDQSDQDLVAEHCKMLPTDPATSHPYSNVPRGCLKNFGICTKGTIGLRIATARPATLERPN
jgi:hypothetical protein